MQQSVQLLPTYAVEVIDDLPFAEVENAEGVRETLRLDVYLPAGAAEGLRPAVLWFHGGGFRLGHDKRQIYIPLFAKELAARGYVGIAPDYRVRADPGPDWVGAVRDALEDARAALAWVRAHAEEYRIDPTHIAVAGGSAGGSLAYLLCHAPGAAAQTRAGIFAMLMLWGPPPFGPLHANPQAPPALLVHGTADALIPYARSAELLAHLQAAGVWAQLLTLPDAPHTPLAHREEIITTVAQFLHDTLARGG